MGTVNSGRIVVHIASAKIPESEGNNLEESNYGQLPEYWSHFSSLIYLVDEFSLKEMKTWGQFKISSYCFCVWCESR